MKKDIDALMEEKNLAAILITGSALHNPAMHYFTGNVHLGHGELVKRRGAPPVLFCNPMERDEAAKSGLETRNLAEYNMKELLQEAEGDVGAAVAKRYQHLLTDSGIPSGRLAIYGLIEAGFAFDVFSTLQALMPELEIVGEVQQSVISSAMETKDQDEIARIRKMGAITTEIVGNVAEFLQSHKAKEGVLVKKDGQPLTIGEIKKKINLWVIEHGVENPHGCIFAIGRDAGVPHSTGNPEDVLELGKTIVFDIYLQETGGGYHYDFTRTWCLGYAPEEEQNLYNDVRAVFDDIMGGIEANTPFKALDDRTSKLFETQGHPTIRQDRLTQNGYVHNLGHGLGIRIHEEPHVQTPGAALKPGAAVTIEPGLYYPEKGMGCRIEDTIWIRPDGEIEILAEYPYDLVLPVENA